MRRTKSLWESPFFLNFSVRVSMESSTPGITSLASSELETNPSRLPVRTSYLGPLLCNQIVLRYYRYTVCPRSGASFNTHNGNGVTSHECYDIRARDNARTGVFQSRFCSLDDVKSSDTLVSRCVSFIIAAGSVDQYRPITALQPNQCMELRYVRACIACIRTSIE